MAKRIHRISRVQQIMSCLNRAIGAWFMARRPWSVVPAMRHSEGCWRAMSGLAAMSGCALRRVSHAPMSRATWPQAAAPLFEGELARHPCPAFRAPHPGGALGNSTKLRLCRRRTGHENILQRFHRFPSVVSGQPTMNTLNTLKATKLCSVAAPHHAILFARVWALLLAVWTSSVASLFGAAQGRWPVGPPGYFPAPAPVSAPRPITPIGALDSSSAVVPQGAPSACAGCPAHGCTGGHCGGRSIQVSSTCGSCGRLPQPASLQTATGSLPRPIVTGFTQWPMSQQADVPGPGGGSTGQSG